jgi:hypothetical protein
MSVDAARKSACATGVGVMVGKGRGGDRSGDTGVVIETGVVTQAGVVIQTGV